MNFCLILFLLKKIINQNNQKSANEKTSNNVSTKTIRRTLHELNIFSRVPAAKPLLNDQQRQNQLNWCRPLVKVEGKMNRLDYIKILEEHLLPLIDRDFNGRGYLFQDNNAPIHTAKDVKDWILNNNVKVLPNWPSQSPDLNPIEHLWSELERQIRRCPKNMKNFNELESALQEEWSKITNDVLMKLIESMPRRIEAVIENNG